ncbi:MAG: hypothetical protein Q4C61_00785 [Lachnospiraceae bacterium]|nr:hypothetical protein [Lachnospiraceae bacterium]
MDERTKGYVVGISAGVAVGIILIAVILKVTKTNGRMKCEFDERQELIRGRGYKYGFGTLILCNVLYAGILEIGLKIPVEPDTAMFLMILMSVLVTVSYWIWNDAYFGLNVHRPRIMAAFVLLAALNLWLGVKGILEGRSVKNGRLTTGGLNLFCGIMFIIVFAVLLAKHLRESFGVQEDEE